MLYETCPDCGVKLPIVTNNKITHRYIGASSSCWLLFSSLQNANEPPIASGELNPLLLDAYCVQHHGVVSRQAINSVAVHALSLFGVLEKGVSADKTYWIRKQVAKKKNRKGIDNRFYWLEPPSSNKCMTIVDIVKETTPFTRSMKLQEYVKSIWNEWFELHGSTLAYWYKQYIAE